MFFEGRPRGDDRPERFDLPVFVNTALKLAARIVVRFHPVHLGHVVIAAVKKLCEREARVIGGKAVGAQG